ncbi:MAG TPA: hypothetical protein VE377_09135 [Candidatus Dormibacteraeota bacterium]|nr:hypothetical protein [Candidatus Dormibacteraeota bacterium]
MAPKLNFCPYKNLPEKGTPGHLFFVKDSPRGPELLLAASNGVLCPVTELFNLHITEAPGAPGKDSMVPGPRGPRGLTGKDSTVPGPKGDKGDPGDITVVGDAELLAAVEKLRAQKAAVLANITERLASMPEHPVYAVARQHLEQVLEEAKK